MTATPNDRRLFADFAAAPTPRERRSTRGYWKAQQVDLFAACETVADAFAASLACPVCSGDHAEQECKHGTAPTLLDAEPDTNSPERVAERRAMFQSFGWTR